MRGEWTKKRVKTPAWDAGLINKEIQGTRMGAGFINKESEDISNLNKKVYVTF